MSINNEIITAPISNSEISNLLSTSNNLSDICTATIINKWAKFKPINYNNSSKITLSQRKSVYMGLSPTVSGFSSDNIYPKCSTSSNRVMNTAINATKEWDYIKPSGGTSSPYRLGDFLDTENPSLNGYNHNAKPPIISIRDEILESNLSSANYSKVWSYTGSNTDWIKTSIGYVYQNINCAMDEASSSWIGGCDSSMLPLRWILGDTIVNDSWRLGIVIWIPYLVNGSICNAWLLVTSKKAFNMQGATTGDLLPDWTTNMLAYDSMVYCKNYKNISLFTCVPVIIKNCVLGLITINSAYLLPTLYSNSSIYGLPDGVNKFTINIIDTDSHYPQQSDKDLFSSTSISLIYRIFNTTAGSWYIAIRSSVSYVSENSTLYPVNLLLIVSTSSSSSMRSRSNVTGTITYKLNGGTTSATKTYSKNSITLGDLGIKDSSGNLIYGLVIMGGNRLTCNYEDINFTSPTA